MAYVTLKSGQKMPMIGLGTWQISGDDCTQAVLTGLELGYRHIDTADVYKNHKDIGNALCETDIPREELFITSKVDRFDLNYGDVISVAERALEGLKTEYLDLFLIHWPNKEIPIENTLAGMVKLQEMGKIRNVGVSNFTINHIREAERHFPGLICVNQVEFHPYLYQKALLEDCIKEKIVLTAYSPLARGGIFKDPELAKLATKYGRSPAQLVLSWLLDKGIVVIPKGSSASHLKDNLSVRKWEIPQEAVSVIDSLNRNERILDPEHGEFDY